MKQSLLALIFLIPVASLSAQEQISIKNPRICHDGDGYLKCYDDGSYKLYFDNGNFRRLTTADSNFHYSDIDKTISFLGTGSFESLPDTVHISLLPHSILFRKKTKTLEVTSLQHLPASLNEFPVGSYASNGYTRGFLLNTGDKSIRLEVWAWDKQWSWNIVLEEAPRVLHIGYNGHRQNRLQNIIIQDDSLRYGTSISTTFRTLNKLWILQAWYSEVVKETGTAIIRQVPLDNAYRYEYGKNGKLKSKGTGGAVKACECR